MMVGAACIGADMWALYLSSARLQRAADAAVQCGAAYLPANPSLAESAARNRAHLNGIRENEIIYNRPASDGRSITMVVERSVPYSFVRLFGQSLVTVKAEAGIGPSSQSAAGVLPIGIQYDTHYIKYRPVELKLALPHDAVSTGIWRPLAMGRCIRCDTRANYQRNLINGYESPVSVGDTVSVEMGDQAAATYSALAARVSSGTQSDPGATPANHAADDPRRIKVPLVEFKSGSEHNAVAPTASVHGFAALWIASIDAKGNINAEFLDFSAPDKFPRQQEHDGGLTSVLLQ